MAPPTAVSDAGGPQQQRAAAASSSSASGKGAQVLTSAAGVLALLGETTPALAAAAVDRLAPLVPQFWHEIAEHVARLEDLAGGAAGPSAAPSAAQKALGVGSLEQQQRASLVASRVYFYLDDWSRALRFALAAGPAFTALVDTGSSGQATDAAVSEFVDTLLAKFIDEYVRQKQDQFRASLSAAHDAHTAAAVDARLEAIVDSMFDRTFRDGQYKEALGIAIECRRMDYIQHAIRSGDVLAMLEYAQRCALDLLVDRDFRRQILETIVKIYSETKGDGSRPVNSLRVNECLVMLDDAESVVKLITPLVASGKGDRNHEDTLTAFQIAFDLAEAATQNFRQKVGDMITESQKSKAASDEAVDAAFATILAILRGDHTIKFHLNFLARHNKADLLVLNQLKQAIEAPRNAVLHSSVVISNALMHAGTTSDKFLRDNLEWLARASNWAKFSAVAGLGVINKGHLGHAQKLLQPYLPGAAGGAGASAYQEGGALYALGLIHANHNSTSLSTVDVNALLLTELASAAGNPIVQHGACLGLGLNAMGTRNIDVYNALRDVLLSDNAIAGEAAGIAMGLVMSGSQGTADGGIDPVVGERIEEMAQYARDTQHEKIIRGLSLGIALCVNELESAADGVIEQMLGEQDPIMRFGGVWAMALAYAGAGAHSGVLQRLLHVAVSAVTDDERRAATTALGFVLHREARFAAKRGHRNSESGDSATATGDASLLPSLARTLSASFNPHVRYGAAMALGVGFAGTGDMEALELLKPLAQTDRVDFVRQGALIAGAMVCIQANDPAREVSTPSAPVTASAAAAAVAAAGGPARLASELLQDQLKRGLPLSIPEDLKPKAAAPAADADGETEMADAGAKKPEKGNSKHAKKDDKKDDKKDGKKDKAKEEKPKPKTPQEEEEAALKQIKAAQRPIAAFRQMLHDKAHDKREELLCRFGAVMAHGIIDAGGRNVTLSLSPISAAGATTNNRAAVCGMALFLQHWFWHPLSHMLSLAMQPTAVIGIDGDLRMPAPFEFECDATESEFAYPQARVVEKKTKAKKVAKAVLSTTRKQEKRAGKADASGDAAPDAEVDMKDSAPKSDDNDVTMADATKSSGPFMLSNPSRVTLNQVPLLKFSDGARWVPIHSRFSSPSSENDVAGIVLLRDTKPNSEEKVQYLDTSAESAAAAANASAEETKDEAPEPEPPAPFTYDPSLEA